MNEIKLKILIDGKEANATLDVTDNNIKELYKSFKYGKQEVSGLTTAISQGFNNAREIIQGFKEIYSVVSNAFNTQLQAYYTQEDALIKLSTALKQNGIYTEDNYNELKAYSAQLQATTKYGDEVTQIVMGQLIAMGLNTEQTKAATLQAANLATIMGTDLKSAARVMADLFNGNAGMIGRYVKGLDESVIKSKDLNKIIAMLNETIGGQAVAVGESASSIKDRMSNAIGDLTENAGKLISLALTPIFEFIAKIIGKLNDLSPTLSGIIGLVTSLTVSIVALNVTGISAIIKNITTAFIPALTALNTSLLTLELSLGPVGWLTLGLTAITGLWLAVDEGQNKAAESMKVYNKQAQKFRLSQINKELNQPDIDPTRKFLSEQERRNIASGMLVSPHSATDNDSTKTKTEDELKKEFDLASKKLEIEQSHQANMLKIQSDNDLLQLELERRQLEKRKALYQQYGQDVTAIDYRLQEVNTQMQASMTANNKAALDESQNDIIDTNEELQDVVFGKITDYTRNSKEQELELWYAAENEKIKGYENYSEMKTALDKEYNARKQDLDDEVNQKTLETYSNMFGALSGLFAKHTAAYKMFALAQTVIDTYQAAQAAYKAMAGIPIVGPGLAVIAAGTAIISGMQRVNAIMNTKTPGYAKGGVIVGENGPEVIAPAKDFSAGWAQVAAMTKMTLEQNLSSAAASSGNITGIVNELRTYSDKIDQWQKELTFRLDGMDFVTGYDKNKIRKNKLKY